MTSNDPTVGNGNSESRKGSPGSNGVRVVMIVANDVTVDTRVQKIAAAVANDGFDVTVLGISTSGEQEELELGPFSLTRLQVAEVLGPAAGRGVKGAASDQALRRSIQFERIRFQNHQRDVGAEIGWLRTGYFEDRAQRAKATNQIQASSNLKHADREQKRRSRLVGKTDRLVHARLRERRKRRQERAEDRHERKFRRTEERIQKELVREQQRSDTKLQELTNELTSSTRVPPRPDWRAILPELHDFESAFGPELDALDPDVIHAHDVHLLGIAVRAADRAYIRGRTPSVIYDAHEYIQGLGTFRPATVAGYVSLEREYIGCVDHVITVSSPIADLLESDYQLGAKPRVVMNIPDHSKNEGTDSIRVVAGLSESDTVVVYSGGIDPTRGVHTLVAAVGQLDSAHLVLVSNTDSEYLHTLTEEADAGGFANRLHVVPFVPTEHVVSYLASADIAVHPMVSGPLNHELALPNKLFEYMQAELPIVVSDCREMAALVERYGLGLVFTSGDADSLRSALDEVINDPSPYKSVYSNHPEWRQQFTWAEQERHLIELYRRIGAELVPTP